MKISRRQFAGAASAAVGAVLVGRRAQAQPAPDADEAPQNPAPQKLAGPSQAEADARLQLIVARWGARLSAGERVVVAHLCSNVQGALEAVRATPLDITDEPAPIFHAARRKHQ